MVSTKRRYWYRFFHYVCPVCSHSHTYRERVYNESEKGHHFEIDTTHHYRCMGN